MTRGLNGRHSLKGIGLAPLGKTEEPLFPGALLNILAERVGFEPTEGLTLRRFSRPVP